MAPPPQRQREWVPPPLPRVEKWVIALLDYGFIREREKMR